MAPERAPVDLNAEAFFGDIVSTLAGTLEDVIGLEDSSAFVSVVGETLGLRIGALYSAELQGLPREPELIGRLLVDLKHRIGGAFELESVSDDQIVFVNSRCPFASRVIGRSSLCMMTTNVFGRITAEARGYARVQLTQTIASGAAGCRVVVNLDRSSGTRHGQEFYS
ncbi:methanogen output domain 1-containing protein [Thalassococcus sp. BH17M4-6]|uniref:methanogen output domain 1-containing protein n=1 Tax=Thalassococcus sp. BH17M4-6 TaxID=3413148 RepID=UPI003BF4FB57